MRSPVRPLTRLLPAFALVLVLALGVGACATGGGPTASFSGATVTIGARDLAFDPDITSAPAGVPLRIVLDNHDDGVGHNIHVFQGDASLGQSDTAVGPGSAVLELGPLAPGRYQFACTIHPSMIGTITVGGPAGS